ncbi:hypothetical protein J2Y69_003093 [Microbacterium resistens]|uniref:Uncharacterized protein n=1 Tax=Microbacterium resistens TaxID=156977 RepID=A0ABU1SHX5_9MICO|nr:hypothetical protein [Microbacterium resistens]
MSTHVDETLVRLLRQGWRGETATDLMREAAARIEALTSAPDRPNRSEDDEFAPGECDGSSTCSAPIHVHGCYAPHRSDQCDSPDEYGHTDRPNGSEHV